LYDEPISKLVREDAPAMKAEILEHRRKYLEMLKRKSAERRSEELVQQTTKTAVAVEAKLSARANVPPCRRGKVGYGF
jgi:hypothetical protein